MKIKAALRAAAAVRVLARCASCGPVLAAEGDLASRIPTKSSIIIVVDRRYQVFVSSTYTDLIEERRELIQALLEMECLPAGMELFPAANESQWELIQQTIDDSDYYVVVVGGRYGSMGPAGVSYTEQEYDYAVSTGMPILGFVHGDPDSLPRPKTEIDPDNYERLAGFREKVKSRPVKFYSSAEDLGGKVSRSLTLARTKEPREGWVRGRFAMTPEVQAEIAELRAEAAELRRSAEAARANEPPVDLAGGEDEYELNAIVSYFSKAELEKKTYERKETKKKVVVVVSWNQILANVGHSLIDEATEPAIQKALNKFAFEVWAQSPPEEVSDEWGSFRRYEVSADNLSDVLIQLFALGYIQRGVKRRPVADHNKYWALTQRGEDALLRLRAIRRTDADPASSAPTAE